MSHEVSFVVVSLHCAVAQLQIRVALLLVAFTLWILVVPCLVVDRCLCGCLRGRGGGDLCLGAWWASAVQCSSVELFHDLFARGCLKSEGLYSVGGRKH